MEESKKETAQEVPVQEQSADLFLPNLKNRKRTKYLNEECINLLVTIADFDTENENEREINIVYEDS